MSILTKLLRFKASTWISLAVVVFALIYPQVAATNYTVYILNLVGIYFIAALGLNVLAGTTKQMSMAQAAFMAIGAYTSTILASKLLLPFWLSIPAGMLFAAFIGFLIAIPTLKLGGMHLAIATLGFMMLVSKITDALPITKGPTGLYVPSAKLGSFVLRGDRMLIYVIIIVAVIALIAANNFMKSRTGRVLTALGDNEVAAKAVGINVYKEKIVAFTICSAYGGLSGGLFAILLGYIAPDNFNLFVSIQFLAMVVVGGMGKISGAFVGAVILTILPEGLRGMKELKDIIYGVLMVLMLFVAPGGLVRIPMQIKNWQAKRKSRKAGDVQAAMQYGKVDKS